MQLLEQLPVRALSVSGAALDHTGGEQGWSALALLGDEAVDTLFDYELLLRLHPGAPAPAPRALLGHGLDLRIELGVPGGAARPARWIHGMVSQVLHLRDDERGGLYALRLRPWAWRATLRGDCRAWRGLSVPQVLKELLRPSGGALLPRLCGRHGPRDYLVQFNESDWDCFARLAAEWGMHFWFEHRQGAHDLVLADDNSAWREQPAAGWSNIGVALPGERDEHECLRALRHGHALTSVGWSGRDDDYTALQGLSDFDAVDPEEPDASLPDAASRTRFHWRAGGVGFVQPRQTLLREPGAACFSADDDTATRVAAERALAEARLQGLRQHARRASGHGPLRGVAAGHRMRLHGHRLAALATDWLVVATRLELREPGAPCGSLGASPPASWAAAGQHAPPRGEPGFGDAGRAWRLADLPAVAGGGWHLRTDVVLQRVSQPLRAQHQLPRPRVWGLQTAVVADPEPGALPPGSVRTDELARVRVRFPWDAQHPVTTPGMRVAAPWAGQALGGLQLPRLGEQLLVGFVDGELERPVGLGALYHGSHRPVWELPRNRALGGWVGRELPGAGGEQARRGNRLLFDDTAGALQVQLASAHLHSWLSLGCLHRVVRGAGRQEARGDGAELRTDGHGLLHSAGAMLLSTHDSADPSGPAADAAGTLRLLQRAGAWHSALARADTGSDPAGVSDAAPDTDTDIGADIDTHAEARAQPGHLLGAGADAAHEPATEDLALAAARGLLMAGDARVHAVAGARLSLAAGRQLGLRAARDLLAQGAQGLRLFTHRLGLRLLSAAGPVHAHACAGRLQAHGEAGLLLRGDDEVLVQAAQGVLLRGGSSFLRIGPAGVEYGGAAFALRGAGLGLAAR